MGKSVSRNNNRLKSVIKVSLEILLATMNQKKDSLLETMKVNTDVIVCNQNTDITSYKNYQKGSYNVRWYDFQEKGVGLNRNNALLRARGDICLLADDDVIYVDEYEKIILDAFEKNPKIDVILFNVYSPEGEKRYITKKNKRIFLHNCGKFGAVRIAFRRNKVIKNAISFNQLFGGGSLYTAGEDTMFIRDCIRKGLKVLAVPQYILKLDNQRPSTWFVGYDRKFFEDLGSSYCFHYRKLALPCAILQLIKSKKRFSGEYKFSEQLKFVVIGIQKFKKL